MSLGHGPGDKELKCMAKEPRYICSNSCRLGGGQPKTPAKCREHERLQLPEKSFRSRKGSQWMSQSSEGLERDVDL